MFSRRSLLGLAIVLPFVLVLPAAAGERFSPAAFETAKKAARPILVEISAPWCPTCRVQKPILGKLLTSEKFKSFVALDVDFDSQKDTVRSLKAQSQSTLIVFKGDKEVARSVGDTNPASIEALLAKAL